MKYLTAILPDTTVPRILLEHIAKKVGVSSKKEKAQKDDNRSSHAQLASLEVKQERSEKMIMKKLL